jgi:hypothetical protein
MAKKLIRRRRRSEIEIDAAHETQVEEAMERIISQNPNLRAARDLMRREEDGGSRFAKESLNHFQQKLKG